MTRDEDALWQEIVDNYDETAEVDDGHLEAGAEPSEDPPSLESQPQLFVLDAPEPEPEPEETPVHDTWEDEGRFVPPPPPRIPLPEPPRMLAWLGLFLAPVIALAGLVVGHPFRGVMALLLVGWFVGGFVYLVRTMNQEPRDPWDDGSRI